MRTVADVSLDDCSAMSAQCGADPSFAREELQDDPVLARRLPKSGSETPSELCYDISEAWWAACKVFASSLPSSLATSPNFS